IEIVLSLSVDIGLGKHNQPAGQHLLFVVAYLASGEQAVAYAYFFKLDRRGFLEGGFTCWHSQAPSVPLSFDNEDVALVELDGRDLGRLVDANDFTDHTLGPASLEMAWPAPCHSLQSELASQPLYGNSGYHDGSSHTGFTPKLCSARGQVLEAL